MSQPTNIWDVLGLLMMCLFLLILFAPENIADIINAIKRKRTR